MKKRERQLLRIKKMLLYGQLEKRAGNTEWAVGLFFLLFLVILVCAEIQISAFQATSLYLEDALAASNLASAVIDIREYGSSHTVRISNLTGAYEQYVRAVKENLQLDENWECSNRRLISGQVTVEKYIVYNVEGNVVSISQVANDGHVFSDQGVLGSVSTPDGTLIERTGIYSEISFPVKAFWGGIVQARKGKLVDIVAENNMQKREGKNRKENMAEGGE